MTTTICDICGKPITGEQDYQSAKGTSPVLAIRPGVSLLEAWRCEDAHVGCVKILVDKIKNAVPAYIGQIKQSIK